MGGSSRDSLVSDIRLRFFPDTRFFARSSRLSRNRLSRESSVELRRSAHAPRRRLLFSRGLLPVRHAEQLRQDPPHGGHAASGVLRSLLFAMRRRLFAGFSPQTQIRVVACGGLGRKTAPSVQRARKTDLSPVHARFLRGGSVKAQKLGSRVGRFGLPGGAACRQGVCRRQDRPGFRVASFLARQQARFVFFSGGGDGVSGILRPAGFGKRVFQGGYGDGPVFHGVRFLGRYGNSFSAVARGLRFLDSLGQAGDLSAGGSGTRGRSTLSVSPSVPQAKRRSMQIVHLYIATLAR